MHMSVMPAVLRVGQPLSHKEMIDGAREKMGMDVVTQYNIGFPGNSGKGKSSLIRGLMQVEADDPGAPQVSRYLSHRGTPKELSGCACQVGETETTQEITRYADPRNKHIMYWDIPGGHTMSHPAETYFEDFYLYMFESLIICFATRLTDLDVKIAAKVGCHGCPVLYGHWPLVDCDPWSRLRTTRYPSSSFGPSATRTWPLKSGVPDSEARRWSQRMPWR
jgi:hypothetical protein